VTLRLDTPPQSILTLVYDLVDDPVIIQDALPQEVGTIVEWQYNEIEMVDDDPPSWRESLLLSNGWEVKLHFRDVTVEEAEAVLPSPRHAQAGISFVTQGAGHD
jgi:hypothetical protein